MNFEDRVKKHFEHRFPSEEPADISDVLARGTRLRRRTHATTAFLSVAGLAVVTLAAASLLGGRTNGDEVALISDQSLQDQIDASWTPIPDPVDPELLSIASAICPFDRRALTQAPGVGSPAGPPELLVIDQRGITAKIVHGMKTTTGEVSTTCSAVKVDGEWLNTDGVDVDWPPLSYGSGGVASEYVAEIRLRFPDGTEVTGSVANNRYLIAYPSALVEMLTEPNSYIYMDSYTADGAFITSEMHMSSRDREQMQLAVPLVGEQLPDFELAPLPDTPASTVGDAPVTVMLIWTSSCPHCSGQLRAVQQASETYADEVEFFGVAANTDAGEATAMLASNGVGFPNWLATGDPDLNEMGIAAVPMTLIADETGTIVAQLAGVSTVEELEAAIATALG